MGVPYGLKARMSCNPNVAYIVWMLALTVSVVG